MAWARLRRIAAPITRKAVYRAGPRTLSTEGIAIASGQASLRVSASIGRTESDLGARFPENADRHLPHRVENSREECGRRRLRQVWDRTDEGHNGRPILTGPVVCSASREAYKSRASATSQSDKLGPWLPSIPKKTVSVPKKKGESDGYFLSERELSELTAPDNTAFPSPVPLQMVSNGEFNPLPQSAQQRKVEGRLKDLADQHGHKLGWDRRRFLRSTCGMAAAFVAMNDDFGHVFKRRSG